MLKLNNVNFILPTGNHLVLIFDRELHLKNGEISSTNMVCIDWEFAGEYANLECNVYKCDELGNTTKFLEDILPISIPTNISMQFKYAAMDMNCKWRVFKKEPSLSSTFWLSSVGMSTVLSEVHDVPKDPLGFKNSLHGRNEDGTWCRI